MNPIGQAPQFQPNLIQSNPQQSAPKLVEQAVQKGSEESSPAPQNNNIQKLAEDILAKRASGESLQKPAVERGQVLDLVV